MAFNPLMMQMLQGGGPLAPQMGLNPRARPLGLQAPPNALMPNMAPTGMPPGLAFGLGASLLNQGRRQGGGLMGDMMSNPMLMSMMMGRGR